MRRDRDLLNRYLDGYLSPSEAEGLDERLSTDAALRARLEKIRRLRTTISSSRSDSFAPYFGDRVMSRLRPFVGPSAADVFYAALRTAFARTAVAGLVVAGALAAYNLAAYGGMEVAASIPEALFGLPSASLMDALSYNAF